MEVLNEELSHLKGKDMEGAVYKSNQDGDLKVVEYINNRNVLVEFLNTGYRTTAPKQRLIRGNIKDKLKPSVCGVGWLGIGEYKVSENGKHSPAYTAWKDMLERCYSKEFHIKNPTYVVCSVHKDWHNFQVFARWFYDNFLEGYALDKDLKVLNNKVYSASTCTFVDQRVNSLLNTRIKSRGDLPVGVYYCKRDKNYVAQCRVDGRSVFLGRKSTVEEAHEVYLNAKINEVKRVANEYKDTLDSTVYNNLVNITKEQLLTLAEA